MSSAFSAPTAGGLGVDVSDHEQNRAQIQAERDRLARLVTGRLEYYEDRFANASAKGGEHRIAVVRCGHCAALVQLSQDRVDAQHQWLPDARERLSAFGWVVEGERNYCGPKCAERGVEKLRNPGAQGSNTSAHQADLHAGMADLRTELDGGVAFTSTPQDRYDQQKDGVLRRQAKVTCCFCPATTEIHQRADANGVFEDPVPTLLKFNWVRVGPRWACGATCAYRQSMKTRNHSGEPLVPVHQIGQPGAARRAYAQLNADKAVTVVSPPTLAEASQMEAERGVAAPLPPHPGKRSKGQ